MIKTSNKTGADMAETPRSTFRLPVSTKKKLEKEAKKKKKTMTDILVELIEKLR